ncbi:MAG: divalent-cation tolerance protein CutA [Chloroflexota bacterium]
MVVLITTGSLEEAERLSRILLQQRACACANLVPNVLSLFRWEGEAQADEEILLIAKTTQDALCELKRIVLAHHSYDVPEIVALPVVEGNDAYLDWVRTEVSTGGVSDSG